MVDSLDQTQQESVYKYYHNLFPTGWKAIKQPKMDETTRRKEINASRIHLQEYLKQNDLTGDHLQNAMIDYLVIREHEDALHLPRTCVADILRPHFQNISHRDLQKVIKRLVDFCSPAVPINPPQPGPATSLETPSDSAALELMYEVLIYNYDAVRAGRIKDPEIIREIARQLFDIKYHPEAYENFPYSANNAGEAAHHLLWIAKWYESHGGSGDSHNV